ncbi:MAG: peptidoglycan-binding domain-containing protein [Deltaproteobacteria bacterium]|nr:peptidoglycan-binding domain-containing protein [Deltaproteobacteria bacterium]
MDFGAARTPQEAIKLLKEILSLLAAGGFPVAKASDKNGGSPEQQLSSTLKQLQKQEGLPQTGQLDKKTFEALDRLGLLPKKEAAPESLDQKTLKAPSSETKFSVGGPRLASELLAPRGGGEAPAGTQKTRSVETEQARARFENAKPDVEVDLRGMLNALKSAGFLGAGKGKEQLTDAVKKLQRVDGLPPTGQLDAKTAESLQKRGVIDAPTAQALKEQDPTWSPPAATSTSSDDAKGTIRGDDKQGQAGPDGSAKGKGESGGPHTTQKASSEGSDGRVNEGDVDGGSEDLGNNYAGDDDDDDPDRGQANVDDDAADAFDHFEVHKLAQQVEEALPQIVRDDDGDGPATYGWDVRLYRPGIYSARQPAEELLHLVVTKAGPFDAVWQQALAAVNEKLARYEAGSAVVDDAALRRALQRARYR